LEHSLINLDSPGRSGARFFLSHDKQFILKTIDGDEYVELCRILSDYHQVNHSGKYDRRWHLLDGLFSRIIWETWHEKYILLNIIFWFCSTMSSTFYEKWLLYCWNQYFVLCRMMLFLVFSY